ncbi:hypothetical protein A3Q56_03072 [Intoshia linei]|uniref:cyclin-dependent kinase n=1 Tax=Intoshia linei TaxID=1819745 RepID=A0A177B4M9_9BILA|nr:hypothetical protein A3Q56_03072 [Intoshia linei]
MNIKRKLSRIRQVFRYRRYSTPKEQTHFETNDKKSVNAIQDSLDYSRISDKKLYNSNKVDTSLPRNSDSQHDFKLNFRQRRRSLISLGFGNPASYQRLDKIGEGTYAIVYKGYSRVTNTIVAIKDIHLQPDEGLPCTAIREASLLRGLKHINILSLHDICYTNTHLSLIFEYMNTDLRKYIDMTNNNVGLKNTKILLYQILRGLDYVHRRNVLHRDLKPQNLLLDTRGELKIGDFGLARSRCLPVDTFTNEVVTLWYRPPDVIMGSTNYTSSIDMWGVGCIFYEMYTGETLFNGLTPSEQLHQIMITVGPEMLDTESPSFGSTSQKSLKVENQMCIDKSYSSLTFHYDNPIKSIGVEGYDLLEKLLQLNAKYRIAACDAIRHPFFTFANVCHSLPDSVSLFIVPGITMEDRSTKSSKSNFYIKK